MMRGLHWPASALICSTDFEEVISFVLLFSWFQVGTFRWEGAEWNIEVTHWLCGVDSLCSLPDDDAKYDEYDGTNHSEDTHLLPGLLLWGRSRDWRVSGRDLSMWRHSAVTAAHSPGSSWLSGAALSPVLHELQHSPRLPQCYLQGRQTARSPGNYDVTGFSQ